MDGGTILSALGDALAGKGVRLLYAAESGSRAWGFASPDSDYDVRFVFASPRDAYLSLTSPVEDVVFMAPGDLDFAGWDLRKTLLLASKSNPSLCEWLGSPIVYADPVGFRAALRSIVAAHFSPKALAHHYVNFMRSVRGKYMADPAGEYTLKRYFYVLRPILCMMWMRDHPHRLPPVPFRDVLRDVALPVEVAREIAILLELKAKSVEACQHKSPALDAMIADWFDSGHARADDFPARAMPIGLLDELFRSSLSTC